MLFFGVYTDAAPIPVFPFSQQLFFDVRNPYWSVDDLDGNGGGKGAFPNYVNQ